MSKCEQCIVKQFNALRALEKEDLKKVDIPLTHGCFLLMKGTTQHYWKHQIPKTSRQIKPRINLTFRIIK